jgi:hypothetical protein
MSTVRGKGSFVGEDSRLETTMAWAGAGHWVARWAAQKEKERGGLAFFEGEAGFWPMASL